MQDPKTGALWGQHSSGYGYWGIPERETDNRIGGDDDRVASGQTTSRWLVASFAHLGAALASEEYVGRALAHWPLAYNSESDAVSHAAETMFAALELERATGDGMYRTVADDCARKIVACQGSDDRYSGWFAGTPGGGAPAYAVVDDGLPGAALAHWLHNSANHPFAAEALACLERYVGFLRAVSDNQLNIARAYRGNSETWFYQYETDRDWYVGQNSQYLSDAWAAFISHRVTGSSEALAVGLDQLDWVLGRNPYGLCMLHGEGRVNTATAHHRYNTIVGQPQGAVPGSVFNGIVRFNARNDIPLWDLIEQGTPRYQCNEPWLPHNAYYLMAVSELGAIRGGT